MRKGLAAAVAVAAILLLAVGTSQAANFRLTIGAGHPVDASAWITSMRDYLQKEVKTQVEAKTPHKIEWVEAYGGSIAKLGEVLEAIESGLMDIGDVHIPFEPAKLMAHNFPYFIPFGSPDPLMASKAAFKVYQDNPQLKEVLEKKYNQVFLAVGAVTCYNLVTTFPWEKVEQLKGRKIAAAGPNIPWVQAIGAVGGAVQPERSLHLDADRRVSGLGHACAGHGLVQAPRGGQVLHRHRFPGDPQRADHDQPQHLEEVPQGGPADFHRRRRVSTTSSRPRWPWPRTRRPSRP